MLKEHTREQIQKAIYEVLSENLFVPVGVSNRHVHVDQATCDILFGKGHGLTVKAPVKQKGQFAANEKVDLVSPKGRIEGVRILGPVRSANQVEVSLADARALRLNVPIRDSGDHSGTPGITLVGPQGSVTIDKGVIVAARHIHVPSDLAKQYGIVDGQIAEVDIGGQRGLRYKNVLLRVREDFALEMHLDVEEANAAGLKNGDFARVIL
ncbi:Phosphate propanoyltransferase [Urinicoccus massiliensis]|uniref:Phosphate propanoyltransferase n=1 Tax=Urinicoccus massiliensis TaxID=1723382 RepID=A0A8H2M8Q5_9FIRM|nr:phosphate propanoyltransferase [Urinicoccus massiliensis]VFB17268.1 Phosphate propanoyltransferase [Urinicoccus massiliensis]